MSRYRRKRVSSHTARPRALKCMTVGMGGSDTASFIPYGSTESTEMVCAGVSAADVRRVSSHTARPRALKWRLQGAGAPILLRFIPYGSTESTEMVTPGNAPGNALGFIPYGSTESTEIHLRHRHAQRPQRVSSHTARPRALKYAQRRNSVPEIPGFIPYGSTESTEIFNCRESNHPSRCFIPYGSTESTEIGSLGSSHKSSYGFIPYGSTESTEMRKFLWRL